MTTPTTAPITRARRTTLPAAAPDTANRILEAAELLLGERGYDGVSMRDVGERAGCTKALVFYHFKSKEALFQTVLDRYYAAHATALSAAFAEDGPLDYRERIHRMIGAYLDFIYAHRLYPRLVMQEIARGSANLERIKSNFAELFQTVSGALEGAVPSQGPLSPKHFFLSFSGMVINYFTYQTVIDEIWGEDLMSSRARDERRRHLLWVADALIDKLEREGSAPV